MSINGSYFEMNYLAFINLVFKSRLKAENWAFLLLIGIKIMLTVGLKTEILKWKAPAISLWLFSFDCVPTKFFLSVALEVLFLFLIYSQFLLSFFQFSYRFTFSIQYLSLLFLVLNTYPHLILIFVHLIIGFWCIVDDEVI